MSLFKINFKLRDIDEIIPWGSAPHQSLHWFGLTDSFLWIQVGEQTIYEYCEVSDEAVDSFEKYNDYQLSRFLEDFFRTFQYVGESVPKVMYDNVEHYATQVKAWKEQYESELEEDSPEADELYDKFYFEEYCEPMEWYWDRSFDSGHLVGGPYIGCFRCDDRIKILWESNYLTDEGRSIWTAPKGCMEMLYEEFVTAVTGFLREFCEAMDTQVEKALQKEWGAVELDKKILAQEHTRRKEGFWQELSFLHKSCNETDWDRALELYQKVQGDLE